jgi:hypothetical protein
VDKDTKLILFYVYRTAEEKSVYVDANTRIQVIDTMLLLPHADREQNAAFIVCRRPYPF